VEKNKFDLGSFIEKHRLWVGGGLIAFILFGAGILLWRENYQKPSCDDRIAALELKVRELEGQKNRTQEVTTKETPNTQDSNIQTEDQGQVAGTSSQNTSQSVEKPHLASPSEGEEPSGKININTASETELDSLTGIGPTYAKRIIEYRNTNGGFKSIDEVKNVKGIGDKTFLKFKDNITI
jgi:comEA protein